MTLDNKTREEGKREWSKSNVGGIGVVLNSLSNHLALSTSQYSRRMIAEYVQKITDLGMTSNTWGEFEEKLKKLSL
ncbi:MAG TPA: hypothetical protein VMU07_00030 [Candidatus Paceibacterota bacterium]|nr:hypothetical protein [Candidatus Paceibacterota bacterium]